MKYKDFSNVLEEICDSHINLYRIYREKKTIIPKNNKSSLTEQVFSFADSYDTEFILVLEIKRCKRIMCQTI